MTKLKCKCGNKGCTTVIFIRQDPSITDVVIEAEKQHAEIALDANDIIMLIKQLKEALNALT
jgi:hypothetical protein